jgi:hypothetical protein
VTVGSDESIILKPFLAAKQVSGAIVPESDPEYASIRSQIMNNALPTAQAPLRSEDGSLSIWTENETDIIAQWQGNPQQAPEFLCDGDECNDRQVVFDGVETFRNISFYKDRNDALLVATQDGVYILEVDNSQDPRNFQPVYRGTREPRFAVGGADELYVSDGGLVFIVDI